jgi:hypothetical protein
MHDPKILALAEAAAERARAGVTIGLALVEVTRDGVTGQFEGSGCYHELHSGLHRLAVAIAMQDD